MKKRFHDLGRLLSEAYKNSDTDKVKELAFEYLNLAAQNKDDWNYGNAIHQANIYFGLLAIENNDIKKAKEYLVNAGQTPGSPQLNSFGPNMLLAKRLLEKGEINVVLLYLDLCKKFWCFIYRVFFIRKWKRTIKRRNIPDFRAHLIYHMHFPDIKS